MNKSVDNILPAENGIHHFNTICVSISKEDLLNLSGHYLIYGSEFICGMAADLSSG